MNYHTAMKQNLQNWLIMASGMVFAQFRMDSVKKPHCTGHRQMAAQQKTKMLTKYSYS